MLLAKFRQDRLDPHYLDDEGRPILIGGKFPKVWDPMKCVLTAFPSARDPIRKNLEFIIGLRNHVEHSHCPDLDQELFGECQALLLNFEQYLTSTFGKQHSLNANLAFTLQTSLALHDRQIEAYKRFFGRDVEAMIEFIEDFHGDLDQAIFADPKFKFRVQLVPAVANNDRRADAAIRFVKADAASPAVAEVSAKIDVLIKETQVPVFGGDYLRAGEVAKSVEATLPGIRFGLAEHTRAARYFKIKPKDPAKPEKTDARYCLWCRQMSGYLYTEAWVKKLSVELADTRKWPEIIGFDPRPRFDEL